MNSGAFLLPNKEGLQRAAEILKSDQILAVPTETVYGLAGNALSTNTVHKIFNVKKRPSYDPLIVHVHSLDQVRKLTFFPKNEQIVKTLLHFWPGAITFIFRKSSLVPNCVTANKESVAIRIPGHNVFRQLLQLVDLPLAAPSANPFSYISPTQAQHVYDNFGDEIPILDGGVCHYGVESTVVSLLDEKQLEILRPGPVSAKELESVSGMKVIHRSKKEKENDLEISPGLSKRHYSPRKPLTLFDDISDIQPQFGDVVIFYKPISESDKTLPCKNKFLSEIGDINEAAQKVFSELRIWDQSSYSRIYFQRFPNTGIGKAVNDRLERAAAQE